jgi:hypothetical protein
MPENAAVVETTTVSTPASSESSSAAPSSSTAAPSTQAATPSSPASERLGPLSSLKELSSFLRKTETPDATTTSTSPVAEPGAATTAQAQEPPKPGEGTSTLKAEPPQEAWPTILENARTKAVKEFQTQYGITPHVTPEVFQKGIGLARQISENPIQFLNELAANLANHPIYGPQLRSSAGRTLASAPAARPEPDVQVLNAQGQVISMTYSAERQQQVTEWDWAQREAKLNERIQPLISAEERRRNEADVAAFQSEVNTAAEAELTRVNDILEGKKELGPKVAELMAQGVNQIDAALMVRKQFIVPTMAKSAEQAVLDQQLKKVAGNTVSGSATQAPKKKLGPNATQKELAAFLRESAEASA